MLTYADRVKHCDNPAGKQLLQLMAEKKTNLAASIDVTKKENLLQVVERVASEICVLKTHIDIVEDFDQELITELQRLAAKHEFIIFEDRKFADIGNTVQMQYGNGIYHIADWSPITNAHIVPGPGIVEGLKEIGLPKGNGLLLLAQMSSKGTLAYGDYTKAAIDLALKHRDFVMGFIAREQLVADPGFLHMTPGVKLASGSDQFGQRYFTPERAISVLGNDIIIVGRGIYDVEDPLQAAKTYRQAAWNAYLARLG